MLGAGNSITDEVGKWAFDAGYKGIRFFSARAIGKYRLDIDAGQDGQAGVYIADIVFEDMREDDTVQNVVIFSGEDLIRSVKAYRVHPGLHEPVPPCEPNPWYGASAAALDEVLEYGSEYQETRKATSPVLVRKPRLAWPFG